MIEKHPFFRRILLWVTLFAIAMGFLESAIVVYIRALLYPHGFAFPLTAIPSSLALTEIIREVATLIMLTGIGVLAGRNKTTRFAFFLYAFAIWDIFYYVFLKLLLDWPSSWMTPDVLFLIPVTWVGPVITPVIVSLSMIFLALLLIHFDAYKAKPALDRIELLGLIFGAIILVVSFSWDYSVFMLHHYSFAAIWTVPSADLFLLAQQYVPLKFNWFLFVVGQIVILSSILKYYKRMSTIR